MNTVLKLSILTLMLTFAGCVTYQPQPLLHDKVAQRLTEIEGTTSAMSQQKFDFSEAMRLMDENNRRLKEIKQAYKTMKDVAEIPTPWDNPTLSGGIKHGDELPNDFSSATQPFVSLAFAVPLSGRLSKTDDLNAVMAEEKATVLKVEHRKLFLKLRRVYGELYYLQQKEQTLDKLIKFVKWKSEETEKLKESGVYSPLDSGLVKQQLNSMEIQQFDLTNQILITEKELAVLLDLPQNFFNDKNLEKPKFYNGFNQNSLKDDVIQNHLDLAQIRAEYEVAEKRLRLEVAKQYPDLILGTGYAEEPGETKEFFNLSVGIKLPIFDRNQVNIAKFSGKRDELMKKYEKTVSEALISTKYLANKLENAKSKSDYHDQKLLVQSQENRDLALDAFNSDQISLLRYWEFEEDLINQQLQGIENYLKLWNQQSDLELLIGKPLNSQ